MKRIKEKKGVLRKGMPRWRDRYVEGLVEMEDEAMHKAIEEGSIYPYFEKCECGGEFESIDGPVQYTSPAIYPVKCKDCEVESQAHLRKETDNWYWGIPQWELKDRSCEKKTEERKKSS